MIPRFSPGQKFRMSAKAWNLMADAAERILGENLPRDVAGGLDMRQNTALIRVSGLAQLSSGKIYGLAEPLNKPDTDPDRYRLMESGISVTTNPLDEETFVVAVPNLSSQTSSSWAVYYGIVWCKVDVQKTFHKYCTIIPGDIEKLKSAMWGRGRILWSPGGTGVKDCLVRLGDWVPRIYRCTTEQFIPASGSGSVKFLNYDESISANNHFSDGIEQNKGVAVSKAPNETPLIVGYWKQPPP